MKFYPTPTNIVKLISKHVPKTAISILEPSVGDGALLESLNIAHLRSQLTLIDIDRRRLKIVKDNYKNSKCINADFINWSKSNNSKFDLIITNPPFSGSVMNWVDFDGVSVPIELAFIELCDRQLTKNGTLIAILPDSIVNSDRWFFLRYKLLTNGYVKYCYKLPPKTFPHVEASFFLLIYKKCSHMGKISIRKLQNNKVDEIHVSMPEISNFNYRLDFDFLYSHRVNDLIFRNGLINKQNLLTEISEIKRGRVFDNYNKNGNLHTTSLKNVPLLVSDSSEINFDLNNFVVALKRVSRNSHLSFSLISKSKMNFCTDCIYLIDSKVIKPLQLLFSLRCLYSNNHGKNLLIKGTGAQFIPVKLLQKIKISDLSIYFKSEFKTYKSALLQNDYETCLRIEFFVLNSLISNNKIISLESYKNYHFNNIDFKRAL